MRNVFNESLIRHSMVENKPEIVQLYITIVLSLNAKSLPVYVCSCLDVMPFAPKDVAITPGRKFDDFYTRLEEIGR